MKNIILLALFIATLCSCEKTPETPEEAQYRIFEECFNDKKFPNLPKDTAFIEGELEGIPFSISKTAKTNIFNNVSAFFSEGYKPNYLKQNEWHGVPISYVSYDSTFEREYELNVLFQSFQGNAIAYSKYFEQFQKGKTFEFIPYNDKTAIQDNSKTGVVSFDLFIRGCANDGINKNGIIGFSTFSNIITSQNLQDQSGSFCRVADLKEYKNADGKIFKRDVTIEFDVKLGGTNLPTKHIKNGRILFSF
jgi:hypothetical protein